MSLYGMSQMYTYNCRLHVCQIEDQLGKQCYKPLWLSERMTKEVEEEREEERVEERGRRKRRSIKMSKNGKK